ncbi:MAG: VOC family protein [Pirellulales bacterium]
MHFSHIGLITDTPQPGEVFVEATKVWITDFVQHPYHIEWLRFEPDSPVTGPVRTEPHVAYRVESLEQAAAGLRVLLEPFQPLPNLRVGFYQSADGAVIEFMEYSGSPFETGS